jgi:DNA-binding transcriptional LysR family regulator
MAQYEDKLELELAIASSTVLQRYLLAGLLAAFGRKYPGVTYAIKQFDSRGVVDAIIPGGLDFRFVGTGNIITGEVTDQEEWGHTDFCGGKGRGEAFIQSG